MSRALLVTGFLAAAVPAHAQSVPVAVVEGPGHPVGEGTVIHPTVSLETGFISNVFYEEDSPVASPIMRLIGAFWIASQSAKPPGELQPAIETEGTAEEEMATPAPAKLDFRLGAQLVLMGYLSTNDRVWDQSDIGAALDGRVVVNPHGDFVFSAEDQFVRDTRPKNFETFGNLNRDFNHLRLGLGYQPGQRALRFGLRYENVIDRFESDASSFASRLQHLVGVRAEWRWLPLTKFYLDGSLGAFGALGDSMGFKSSSTPLRIQVGVGTALTMSTTVVAHIGYGNGMYSAGQSFQNVIGGVEFGYRYSEYGRVRLTFDYDFDDSMQANFYRDFAFLAKLDQQIGLIILGAEAGVRLRGYRGISPVLGPPTRDDVVFDAAIRANYLLRDRFAITARLEALIDETDYMYSAPPTTDSPKFQRIEAVLGAVAAF